MSKKNNAKKNVPPMATEVLGSPVALVEQTEAQTAVLEKPVVVQPLAVAQPVTPAAVVEVGKALPVSQVVTSPFLTVLGWSDLFTHVVTKTAKKVYNGPVAKTELVSTDKTSVKQTEAGVKRYELFGHAITSVIRWLGNEGYTAKPVARMLKEAYGLDVPMATIQTQCQAGKAGRGKLPELSPEQIFEINEHMGAHAGN
jgi:hypothetical protein